jgi:hypothetical protein
MSGNGLGFSWAFGKRFAVGDLITGTISGDVIQGVTVYILNSNTRQVVASGISDSFGNYSVSGLANGIPYDVLPMVEAHTFNPHLTQVTLTNSDVVLNFTSISGSQYLFDDTTVSIVDENNIRLWEDNLLWTPSELGTAYWWDASDTGTIVESANAVSSWTDKNQGSVLDQGNVIKQPVTNVQTINGLNVIDFQGDDYLDGTNFALTEWTKLVVFSLTTSTDNNLVTNASGAGDAFFEDTNTKLNVFHSGTVLTSTTVMTLGQTFLGGTTKATNGDTELFVYGNSEGTVNDPFGTGALPFQLGAYGTSFFLDGKIAEVILLPSVINISDRQKAEGYLAHKWGFTADLDVGHPYKSAPPQV